MFELFMYVYSCNALTARFFAVDRALNFYFMVMIILPVKAREYVFTGVGLCFCPCVCLTMITKKIVDGFVPNFMGRFLGGKESEDQVRVLLRSVEGCRSNSACI